MKPWKDSKTPALAIVARGDQITCQSAIRFTVRSQSAPDKTYSVVVEAERSECNCAFHGEHKMDCIHILAVRYYLEIVTRTGAVPKVERVRLTYPQAWSAYNAAQAAEVRLFDELLSNLVQGVPDLPYNGDGRPALPLNEQIFCSVQKVYSQLSSRRSQSLFGFAAGRGQLGRAPHFNVSSRFLNRTDATQILRKLVRVTAAPLAGVESQFAIDSTGFRTRSFGAYCAEKHGTKKEHRWLKAHLSSGIKTNVVTDVVVTDSVGEGTGDSTQVPALLEGTMEAGFRIEEILADKAYSTRPVHAALEAHHAGALIPFRSNAKGLGKGSALWHKAFYFFQLHRDAFEARYHKRSNVESTIGAIKKKLGESLKSKNRVAQENELLCKIVAYNITVLIHEMFENGVAPDFGAFLMEAERRTPARPPAGAKVGEIQPQVLK
ncbi:MAG: transposase [Euryarchaeota archaeon]|nr:transposase [Euryarchaeota archaeon]